MYNRWVRWWLWIGVGMVVVQIVLGGITRLTDSGLSITEWSLILGIFPPTSDLAWNEAFDLYKATPQYEKINKGMELSAFKSIYYWEYLHRFWGRLIGFVFLIPFIIFLAKGWIQKQLIGRLIMAFLFGSLVGLFGWIMVASGLINRPWVNAYKLMIHLGLAVLLLGYMVFVSVEYEVKSPKMMLSRLSIGRSTIRWMTVIVFIQILLGALMSGMKAGLFFPTWPSINGSFIPEALFHVEHWSISSFYDYDSNLFMPALIQFMHRVMAYFIVIFYVYWLWKFRMDKILWYGFCIVLVQVVLGILTLINCIGHVPLALGVLHQLGGVLLFVYMTVLLTRKSLT